MADFLTDTQEGGSGSMDWGSDNIAQGTGEGVASGAASGGPMAGLGAGLGLVGLGLSAYGTYKQSQLSKQMAGLANQEAGINLDVAKQQQDINDQRKQQMILTSNRQQLQTIRNSQLARSMALTASTASGSQFGSGLQGGYGQIGGDTGTNLLNLSQNLEIGKNIFGFDDQISNDRIKIAGLQGQEATIKGQQAQASATSAFGGDLTKAAGTIAQLAPLLLV